MATCRFLLLYILTALLCSSAYASITKRGTGMLFGADHAFFFTAPNGWVLDNESGVQQGIHMIFYPAEYTWSNSPVIAYGRAVTKDNNIRTIKHQVASTLREFHSKGSKKYKVTRKSTKALSHGKRAVIYYYEGDKWGNYEAAGYIDEKNTINFLVFNARKKADFDKYLPAFMALISTYWSAGSSNVVDDKTFNKLVQEAKRMSSTPNGQEYEMNVIKKAGKAFATYMRDCSSYVDKDEVGPFEAIFKIKPDGSIIEAFVRPETALSTCFEGLFMHTRNPSHQFDSFLLHIDMKIK